METQISKWMPLIRKLSAKYKNTIAGFDDFVNEGVLSVICSTNIIDNDNKIKKNLEHDMYSYYIKTAFAVNIPSGSFQSVKKDKHFKSVNIEDIESEIENSDKYCNDEFENTYSVMDIEEAIEEFDEDNVAKLYFLNGYSIQNVADMNGYSIAKAHRILDRVNKKVLERCK